MRTAPETQLFTRESGEPYGFRLLCSDDPAHDVSNSEILDVLGVTRLWRVAGMLRVSVGRSGIRRYQVPSHGAKHVRTIGADGMASLLIGDVGDPSDTLPIEPELTGAWDTRGAFVQAPLDSIASGLIGRLSEAALKRDLAVVPVPDELSEAHSGLWILRLSATPLEIAGAIIAIDEARKRLVKRAHATGVQRALRRAGVECFALEPRWADKARTQVEFWFNPVDSVSYKPGSYTPDVLLQLARDGEGPAARSYDEMGISKPRGAHGIHG